MNHSQSSASILLFPIIGACVALCSCKTERHFAIIDKCRDIEKSATNLGENGKSFYLRNGHWPHQGPEFDGEIKRSNSDWRSFSGGSQNWKIETTVDNEFKVAWIGKGAIECKKTTYVFATPEQAAPSEANKLPVSIQELVAIRIPKVAAKQVGLSEMVEFVAHRITELDPHQPGGISFLTDGFGGAGSQNNAAAPPAGERRIDYTAEDVRVDTMLSDLARLFEVEFHVTSVGVIVTPTGGQPFPNAKAEKGETYYTFDARDGGQAPPSHEPVPTNADSYEAKVAELAKAGMRFGRDGDVPFVYGPAGGQSEVLLERLKEAGVFLALPDRIDLGMCLWKIAPEDLEKGRAVVEQQHLRELLKDLRFDQQTEQAGPSGGNILPGQNVRLSAKEINERVIEHRFDRKLELPEQRLDQRVSLLNALLKERGFTSEMVVVSIDPSMDEMLKGVICPGWTLPHPKMSLALTVTMDRFAMMYGVSDGEIRFMRMNEENIKKYPTLDRPDPRGP